VTQRSPSACSTIAHRIGPVASGDPVADSSLIGRPEEAFLTIIKGGHLVKGGGVGDRF
jgi:hypothetical protein